MFSSGLFAQQSNNDSTTNGKYRYYLKDSILVKGYYKDVKRHKIWTWYNKDGTRSRQTKYKHGKQLWTLYFEKDKAWLRINRYGKRTVIKECDCRVINYD